MKKLIAALVFGFCAVAGGFAVAGVPEGYVTQDLIACWDAIDNQATGVHDPNATSWIDLVGGAKYDLFYTTWEADALSFNGTPVSYGVISDKEVLARLFGYAAEGGYANHTVELVFQYDDADSSGCIFVGMIHSSKRDIALGRYVNGSTRRFICNGALTDWYPRYEIPGAEFCTVSSEHHGEWDYMENTFMNNVKVTKSTGTLSGWGGDANHATIGRIWGDETSCFRGRLYAIRIYGRNLTAAEKDQNYQIDVARFKSICAATVVSGSVTVDGKTYGEGDVVRMDADARTLAIESATDATLALDRRVTTLEITNGAVSVAASASGELLRLADLSLGASATLKLPSSDLYVSGMLTAEAGAVVKGPGTLIAAAATSPVDLADGAGYLCATAAFSWPQAGAAYIPVGAAVAIDDTAKVDALDKVVFLSETSRLTYGGGESWEMATSLEGPGTFDVTSAGPMTLAADNRNLTGTFKAFDTCVAVSNRYGLGSARTKLVDFNCNLNTKALRFGGEGLVCDAPIDFSTEVVSDRKCNTGCIGPDLPTETLVLSNSFRVMGVRPSLIVRHRIRFSGGYVLVQKTDAGASQHFYTSKSADSSTIPEIWLDEGVLMHMNFWYASDCFYHFGATTHNYINMLASYEHGAKIICEAEDVLASRCNSLTVATKDGYIDLNGFDQNVQYLTPYVNWDDVFTVTSAVPAVVTVTARPAEDKYLDIPARFCGAVGYSHAIAACTNGFYKHFSNTTGPLTIEKGGLRLRNGAGWGGTNVTVKAGASLIVADTAAAQPFVRPGTRAETTLTVEETGTLVLDKTDKPVKVRNFTYAGVPMERGIYTKANCAGIDGEGALSVLGHPGLTLIVR